MKTIVKSLLTNGKRPKEFSRKRNSVNQLIKTNSSTCRMPNGAYREQTLKTKKNTKVKIILTKNNKRKRQSKKNKQGCIIDKKKKTKV